MRIAFSGFRGLAPKFNPEDLADDMATEAVNVRPGRGILEPWSGPLSSGETTATTKSLYKYMGLYWFESGTEREYSRVPLNNDPFDYLVITDSDYPKITRNDIAFASGSGPYPNTTYPLGVPIAPQPDVLARDNTEFTVPVGESLDNEEEDSELNMDGVRYKITLVDVWDREGAGSYTSDEVLIRELFEQMKHEVVVSLPTQFDPAIYSLPLKSWRIYRLNTSSSGMGVYQFVAEVAIASTSYIDRIPSSQLQEAMITDDCLPAPDNDAATFPNGPLRGICAVASSFLAGHNERMVCFSEPGTTHAWPATYYKPHIEKIVAVIPRGGDLVVLTDSYPYIYTGVHPSSMSPVKLSDPVPASSRKGCVEVGGVVYFVSPRGLFAVDQYQVVDVSSAYFTEKQWKNLNPSTMRLAYYRSYLLLNTDTGRTLLIDTSAPQAGFFEVNLDVHNTFNDGDNDDLYFSSRGSTAIFKFDSDDDNPLPVTWKSKVYKLTGTDAFTCARVRANKYPTTVTFCAEKLNGQEVRTTKEVSDDTFFWLPTSFRARKWWVEVENQDCEIRSIELATSPMEFPNA